MFSKKGLLVKIKTCIFYSHLFFKGLFYFFTSTCEGAQGLFVQCLHARICTGNSSSQNLCMGQHSNRYAIHAGRQLNVKEFCYLRTVRVTAAVCLWPLGRRQTIYLEKSLHSLEFLVNSRCYLLYFSFFGCAD